ncbi:hypothetical protein FRC09_014312 [Ceratobasidium sp. 395]|nr:hypothetical protein FRC09_014312 [Ceratobasidium sp. 395]
MDINPPVDAEISHASYYWSKPSVRRTWLVGSCVALTFATVFISLETNFLTSSSGYGNIVPQNAQNVLDHCARLTAIPNRPVSDLRRVSDRFEPGTKPVLILNATIWTGVKEKNERVKTTRGDLLLDGGVIRDLYTDGLGSMATVVEEYGSLSAIEIKNANGAWVTPAIFDMHSHVGTSSLPGLRGAEDDNSLKSSIMPFLRSFDGLNTHDEAYDLFRAGGVATSLVLPGSADNIGGQAVVVKLGKDARRKGPSAMILEPPDNFFVNHNRSAGIKDDSPRWRHIKHACGENPSRVYSQTRMDSIWQFRQAYDKARQLLHKQNDYCASAELGRWNEIREKDFPQDLEYEALVDVLRGKVKVHIHCYETVDMDGLVRLSNEFKFPIAAFHHAHEAYLIPDLIKKAWGKTPALAIFSMFARYKREAYRGSEFAAKILNDNGLKVIMKFVTKLIKTKSDGPPALNARYLMYEAALAHYYGLPADAAIASLTTTPAEVAGYAHRLGYIKPGYDADLVIWDSYPLSLSATPQQVYIDGVAQLENPAVIPKPTTLQEPPSPPSWEREAHDALASDGMPNLIPAERDDPHTIIFRNVSLLVQDEEVLEFGDKGGTVVAKHGSIVCSGKARECDSYLSAGAQSIDIQRGSILPGLISFGAAVGLMEIDQEPSTNDGATPDLLEDEVPKIAGGDDLVVRAVDGLSFAGRNALLAHRGGVTTMIEAPFSYGLIQGVSVAFRTGAGHRLEPGAISRREVALHARIIHDSSEHNAMVSTKIATLRRLLLGGLDKEEHSIYARVIKGGLPLVVSVEKADIMATLLQLKLDIEKIPNHTLHLVFAGATEAHLLANEISEAKVGVILAPLRSFPRLWDQKRFIPGPPLSPNTPLHILQRAGVTVGLGVTSVAVTQAWDVQNTRFNLGWAILDSNGTLGLAEALALSTTNMKKLFRCAELPTDFVVFKGGSGLDYSSKPLGVLSPIRGRNELF